MITPKLSLSESKDCSYISFSDDTELLPPHFKGNITCRTVALYDYAGNLIGNSGKKKSYCVGLTGTIVAGNTISIKINTTTYYYTAVSGDIVASGPEIDGPTATKLTYINLLIGLANKINADTANTFLAAIDRCGLNTCLMTITSKVTGFDFLVSTASAFVTIALTDRIECNLSVKKRFTFSLSTFGTTITANSLVINSLAFPLTDVSVTGTTLDDTISLLATALNLALQVGTWQADIINDTIFVESYFELGTLTLNTSSTVVPVEILASDPDQSIKFAVTDDGVYQTKYTITEVRPLYYVSKFPALPVGTTANILTNVKISCAQLFGSSFITEFFPTNGSAVEFAQNIANQLDAFIANTLKVPAGAIIADASGSSVYIYVSADYLNAISVLPAAVDIEAEYPFQTLTFNYNITTTPSVASTFSSYISTEYFPVTCKAKQVLATTVISEASSCSPESVCMPLSSRLDALLSAVNESANRCDWYTANKIIEIIKSETKTGPCPTC